METQQAASLLRAAHESNYVDLSADLLDFPRRRSHLRRDEAQQIACALFPEFTEEKAIIRYEEWLKLARSAYISRQAAEQLRKAKEMESRRPDRLHEPWDPINDPLDLGGPKALPMPVRIGKQEDFEDCFAFLKSNADDQVGGLFDMPDTSSAHPDLGFIRGEEPVYKTRMIEFRRGVVYEDGRLDLCKKVVGPDHIDDLMDSLENNTHIRHFLLGNNVITNHGARRIAKFIEDHPDRMETWYLAGNHIKPAGLHAMAKSLQRSQVLTNLWLKRNPLGPGSVDDLVTIFKGAANLRVLDIEACELGDEGISGLFERLQDTQNRLETIFMNGDGIGVAAATQIGQFLRSPNCHLRYLMMSGNPLGDSGASALSAGLSANTTLEVLTVASCGLSSLGISHICDALIQHPSIRSVDISSRFTTADLGQRFNHISDEAVEAIKHLVANQSLRFLELGYAALSHQGLEEIRDEVAAGSSLVGFSAQRIIPPEETSAAGNTCSLRVRQALEANYLKFYGGVGQVAGGVPYDDFIDKNGGSRLLRNCPDVRLIDSVYRVRDKGATSSGRARKFWDLDVDGEDKRIWERLDAIQ
ncbi:uncharacterized protein JN550_000578 [Neoarthrinium moseri]|uniref:uncharacterized protein n=1 Tax=Neoarthrinium moseri TaxID=1658444 RepID=UPI001FDE4F2E|nr:uncharacterized protein JN550_000578 [Neoarthrinium moseri]KAI1878396.1 hypothetical protein JN550_000578 [Neoarthrinium moseri]